MKKTESEYVKKRKSYYGFAKDYPGKLGSSKYVIGDSIEIRRKENIRRILIVVFVIFLFAATFVFTTVGLRISERPVTQNIITEQTPSDVSQAVLFLPCCRPSDPAFSRIISRRVPRNARAAAALAPRLTIRKM